MAKPSKTVKGRENELINMAVKLAEKKLKDGTAPSQIIVHFLKLATERERLENEKLRSDLKVAEAKVEKMKSETYGEEMYERAIQAMRRYQGNSEVFDEDV